MEVSVDTAQLNAAKIALSNFSQAMADISSKADKTADSVVEACRKDIEIVNCQKELAEASVRELEADICEYDEMTDELQSAVYQLDVKVQQSRQEARDIDSVINEYRSRISSLEASGADKDGGNGEELADSLRKQVRTLENRQENLNDEAAQFEKEQLELNSQILSMKSKKSEAENELSVQKTCFDRLSTKFEKLRVEADRVDSELRRYVDAVKVFESSAQNQTDSNISSIERCIALIDEYAGINL